mmetsp:Transcript_972/g.2793  ORF Transcript_972/g.2793 Transcript_972/m.2793 type:complete len:96 (+) Transcript_972:872-1159(+)
MVVHVPSLFVGTVFAGSGFLLLHRELSHRSRLTYRWVLAEKVEEQYREFWAKAKAANKVPLVKEASVQTAGLTAYTVSAWNKGVNTLRNALNKDE